MSQAFYFLILDRPETFVADDLKTYMLIHSREKFKPHTCDLSQKKKYAGEGFIRLSILEKPYTCELCKNNLQWPSILKPIPGEKF